MVHTFLGQYPYRIDDKGRVAIPARLREAFKEGVVLAQSTFYKCISVYSVSEWEKMAQRLTSLPLTPESERIMRSTGSSAFNLELDRQGRVVLPPSLKDHAAVKSEVVIVGVHTHLEIWSVDNWAAEKAAMREQATQTAGQVEPRP